MRSTFCSFLILLIIESLYSQNTIEKKLNFDDKIPLQSIGHDNDEVQFYIPFQIRYNKSDEKIYVADAGNHRIVILDKELKFETAFGQEGQGPGEFVYPGIISFDSEGYIYVYEYSCTRIQKFDRNKAMVKSLIAQPNSQYFTANNNGELYFINANESPPILLRSFEKNEIDRFGVLLEPENKYKFTINEALLFSKNDLFLYCAFRNRAIIRKYDKKHNLVLEINYGNFPEAKKRAIEKAKEIEESRKKATQRRTKIAGRFSETRDYISDISVDDNYIYLLIKDTNIVIIFNKLTGEKVGKINFFLSDTKNKDIVLSSIDATDSEYIYAIDASNMVILKYKK